MVSLRLELSIKPYCAQKENGKKQKISTEANIVMFVCLIVHEFFFLIEHIWLVF